MKKRPKPRPPQGTARNRPPRRRNDHSQNAPDAPKYDQPDKSLLDVDRNRLDEEFEKFSKEYDHWSDELVEARRLLGDAEEESEVVFAECDAEIRADPKRFGIDKVTETAIKNLIPSLAPYRRVKKRVLDLKHRVNLLTAFVKTLDKKFSSLENLTKLHGQQYFAVQTRRGAPPRRRGET